MRPTVAVAVPFADGRKHDFCGMSKNLPWNSGTGVSPVRWTETKRFLRAERSHELTGETPVPLCRCALPHFKMAPRVSSSWIVSSSNQDMALFAQAGMECANKHLPGCYWPFS